MEYECSWIGQGERLVDSRRKNGASKKEDNKYIPLETMIELGLIKLVQVSLLLPSPFVFNLPSSLSLPYSFFLCLSFHVLPLPPSLPLPHPSIHLSISPLPRCFFGCTCVRVVSEC